MKAFDTDILTEILAGNPAYAERIAHVLVDEQAAPIVAVEESSAAGSTPSVKRRQAKAGPLSSRRKCSSSKRLTTFAS